MSSDNAKDYKYIISEFGEDVIKGRANWLKELMDAYIRQESLEDKVYISETIFTHVIIDYFADIERLKKFHWILRHKPIQIQEKITEEFEFTFVNEKFCVELLRSFLFDDPANIPIRQESSESINDFINTMLYFFKYRNYSAKSIELVLIAFKAGRGYQFSVDHQR